VASDSRIGVFATTHWSVVLAAQQPDARAAAALDALCQTYWYPLYAFARFQGQSPEDARDLTQEFFARLLASGGLGKADRARGRFRTFLLASFKHLLANEWKRANRQKRGGGAEVFSLDEVDAEGRYKREAADATTPEMLYERRWAEAFLSQVIERLRAECDGDNSERGRRFAILKAFLVEEKGALSLAEAASQLGLSVVATKGVVHRLRQRYRDIFREEIARVVAQPEDTEDEIRHLLEVLARA
jgi:RNA polymerase sigma factor (sigma-70 family)